MVAPSASQRTVPAVPLPPLGARVEVFYDRRRLVGTVRFAGVTAFASGSLVGVALDSPIGKNDGSVMGMRYFDCAPNHGLFVRPKAILSVEPPEDMPIAQVYNPEWSGMRYTPEPSKPQRRRVKALREIRKADQSLKSAAARSKADWIEDEVEGQNDLAPLLNDRSLQDSWSKEGAVKFSTGRMNQDLPITTGITMDEQKESRATRMQSRGLEVFFNAIGRVASDVEERAEQWFEDQGAETFADIQRYGLEESFTNSLNLKIVQQKKAYAFWDMQAASQEARPVSPELGQKANQKSRESPSGKGLANSNEGSEPQRAEMMAEILAPVLESNGFSKAAINDIVNESKSDQSTAAGAKSPDWIRILSDIHGTMAQLAESAANAEKQAAAAATAAAESECRISEAIANVAAETSGPPEAWLRAIMDRIDRCDASARESARRANEACERLQQRFEEIIAAADRDESPSPRSYPPEEPASLSVGEQRVTASWPQATPSFAIPSFTPPVQAVPVTAQAIPQLYSDDELSPFYSGGIRGLATPSSPSTSFSPLVMPMSPQADIRVLAPEGLLDSPQNRIMSSRSPSPMPARPAAVTSAVPVPVSVAERSGNSSFPGVSGPSAMDNQPPKLLAPVISLASSTASDAQLPTIGTAKADKSQAKAVASTRATATFGLPGLAVTEGANSSATFGIPTNQAALVQDLAPVTTVGFDSNNIGKIDVLQQSATADPELKSNSKRDVVTDKDGDCDEPLEASLEASPPVATVGLDLNSNGKVDVVVTGEERNRDGIPDVLQQTEASNVSLNLSGKSEGNAIVTGEGSNLGNVSNVVVQQASPPTASVGLDLNGNGKADVVVTGEDRNNDGIPDVLQQPSSPVAASPLTATVGLDLNGNGKADVVVTGEDRNNDGIPDVLQQPSSPVAVSPPTATVSLDLNGNGKADVVVTGEDRNNDGIPDVLQQLSAPVAASAPTATVGLDLNGNGKADVVVTGEDRNGDGIPDVLQQQSSPVAVSPPTATVGLDLNGNGNGKASGDGIPAVLQQSISPVAASAPTVAEKTPVEKSIEPESASVEKSAEPEEKAAVDVAAPEKKSAEAKDKPAAKAPAEAEVSAEPEKKAAAELDAAASKSAPTTDSKERKEDSAVEAGTGSSVSEAAVPKSASEAIAEEKPSMEAKKTSSSTEEPSMPVQGSIVQREEPAPQQSVIADLKEQLLFSSALRVQQGTDVKRCFLVLYNDRCDQFEKAEDFENSATPVISTSLDSLESFHFIDDGFAMSVGGVKMSFLTSDNGTLARWSDAWNTVLDIDDEDAEEQTQVPLHEGSLGVVKKDGAKPQHFVLFADRFQYFTSKEALLAGEKPLGRLPFADITDFIVNPQNLGFVVNIEEGKMHLRSNSPEEYDAWRLAWTEAFKTARPELPFLRALLLSKVENSSSDDPNKVLFHGYLSVMKKNNAQQRYFALFPNRVEYWSSPADFHARLKSRGSISVQDVKDVRVLDDGFLFTVTSQGVVQLRADGPAALKSWIGELERVFKVVKATKPDRPSESDNSSQVLKVAEVETEVKADDKGDVKVETKAEAKAPGKADQPILQGESFSEPAVIVCQGFLGYNIVPSGDSNAPAGLDISAIGDSSRIGCPMMLNKVDAFETLGGGKGFVIGLTRTDLELRTLDSKEYARWKEAWQSSLDFEDELAEDEQKRLEEEDEDEEDIIHQGVLGVVKRDGVVWKHFALFIDRLNYYTSAADFAKGEQPSGHVKLAEIKEFTANDDDIAFTIGVEAGKMNLRAETRDKFLEWKGKWAGVLRRVNPEFAVGLGKANDEGSCLLQGPMSVVRSGGDIQLLHFVLFKDRLEYFSSAIDYTHGLQPSGRINSSDVKLLEALEDGFKFSMKTGVIQLKVDDYKLCEWAGSMAWVFQSFIGTDVTGNLGGTLMVLKGNDAQQRHFVIFDDRMEYYTAAEDFYNNLEPRGQLVFKNLVEIKVAGKDLHFAAPSGVVILRAPGKRELKKWKSALEKVVNVKEQESPIRTYTLPPDMKTRYFILYENRLENFTDEFEFKKNAKLNSSSKAIASDASAPITESAEAGARPIIMKGPMGVDKEGVLQIRYFVLVNGLLEYWKSSEEYDTGQPPRGKMKLEVFKECEAGKDGFKFSSIDGSVTLKTRGGEDFESWRDSLIKVGVLRPESLSPKQNQKSSICEGVLGAARSGTVKQKYFALYQDRLDYYNDTDITDAEQRQPDGKVYVSEILSHKISDTEFQLHLANSSLVLQLSDPADLEKWKNGWAEVLGSTTPVSTTPSEDSNWTSPANNATKMQAAQRAMAERKAFEQQSQQSSVLSQPANYKETTVVCEGILGVIKQGATESRYFVLTLEHLDYYLTEDQRRAGERQRGRVVLDDVEDLVYGTDEFSLVLNQGSMQLIANSKADFARWKDAWSQIFEPTD